ncbi:MAG: AI-2E family transporter [Pseudomonadota bacterium]
MKTRDKALLYLLITALFLVFLYLIKSILFPFIAAIIVAYFLDPLADRIKKLGLSRTSATAVILGGFLLVIIILLILILPLLYSQAISLAAALPGYIDVLVGTIYPRIFEFLTNNGFAIEPDLHSYFNGQNIANFFNLSGDLVGNIMQSGIVFINVVSLIFITPVLVFYMLRDWDLLVEKIDHYLPAHYSKNIRNIFIEIDKTLSGYVHGQFNVCLILGICYALALTFSGLNFGFLIGFLTGFLSFIPYIGMLLGITTAIVVGLFQWGLDPFYIGVVAVIFLTGQIFESNFLTPKLVGNRVGLHPVWIIFGLFVFGVLLGFVGVLLAMPLTAICGVLIKSIAVQYKKNFVG